MSTRIILERDGKKEQAQHWWFMHVRNFQPFFSMCEPTHMNGGVVYTIIESLNVFGKKI